MPSPIIIDPDAIENLRSLNPDDADAFLRDIIGIYLEDTPQRIAELRECLASKDQAKFTRAAHSIKGSSSNLGAAQLQQMAAALEHRSKNQGLDGIEPDVTALDVAYAAAKSELERIMPPA